MTSFFNNVISKKLTSNPTIAHQSFEYIGCVTGGNGWVRQKQDVRNTFEGAENCGTKCKEDGYKYWGLECPQNTMHCQCSNDEVLDSGTRVGDDMCKEFDVNSGAHCKGPFTSSSNWVEYFHGAGSISSVYLTGIDGKWILICY